MVEEVKTNNQEGTVIPGESEGSSQAPDLQAQHEVALKDKAKQSGWKPLKEWDGDPADWVSAREFVARQSFFDKIRSQSAEIKNLHNDIKWMANNFVEMKNVAYKRALADLKAQRKDAINESNTEKAEQISDQITELETGAAKAPQVQSNPVGMEEFNQWKIKETWYDKDPELNKEANSLGIGYAQVNPGKTPQEVLSYVSEKIRKMYPEKFGKKVIAPASPESGGVTGNKATKGNKFTESDLNDMQKKMMKTYIQRGILTKEQYLDQLSMAESVKNATSLDK